MGDTHKSAINSSCRVCGGLLNSKTRKYGRHLPTFDINKNQASELQSVFGIHVENDDESNPKKMCWACYKIVNRSRSDGSETSVAISHSVKAVLWSPHNSNCEVCERFLALRKGGRPKKLAKNRGRPSKICVPGPDIDSLPPPPSVSSTTTALSPNRAAVILINQSLNTIKPDTLSQLCTKIVKHSVTDNGQKLKLKTGGKVSAAIK